MPSTGVCGNRPNAKIKFASIVSKHNDNTLLYAVHKLCSVYRACAVYICTCVRVYPGSRLIEFLLNYHNVMWVV